MKKICLFLACHTNSLQKYFSILNNIHQLKDFIQDIYIVNSIDAKYNQVLKNDLEDMDYIKGYYEIENNIYLDFGKWIHLLGKVNYKLYDYVLFSNDSIIIVEKLHNFFSYIQNLDEQINIYGYNDSSQLGILHYQSYLFLIKCCIMNKFINLFHSRKHLIHNQESLIENMEINIIKIDKNHDCFLKIAKEWNSNKNIFWENDELYEKLLSKNIFHLLKIKKIHDYINFYQHNIENYGDFFNKKFYKNNYDDLGHLSEEDLFDHFKGFGFQEGRNSHYNFYNILPEIYIKKLKQINLENIFNIPHDFDIYYYKSQNPEMLNLSNEEIIKHFYFNSLENDIIDFKNSNNIQNYNKLYKSYIKKYFNLNIELDDKFSYKKLLAFNPELNKSGILKNIINYFYRNDLIPNINLDDYNMEIEWIKRLSPEMSDLPKEELYGFLQRNKKANNFKDLKDQYIEFYKEHYNLKYLDAEYIKHHYKYKESLNKENIFNTFSAYQYKCLNKKIPGMLSLTPEKAKHHYFTEGFKKKLLYKIPDDFNHIIYKYLYFNEFKNFNESELIDHYLNFGYQEKRNYKLPKYFHLQAFKIIYKKNEITQEELLSDFIMHYIMKPTTKSRFIDFYNFPKYEQIINEILPNDFNPYYYKILNSDLKILNDYKCKVHYIEYGYDEKREYKIDDFDVNYYKLFNTDLGVMSDEDYFKHYFQIGKKEGRLCNIPKNFTIRNYKKLNPDLKNLKQEELLNHFITLGIKEGRIWNIPGDFDPMIYQSFYKDLSDLSELDLYLHYAKMGINENRIYKLENKFNPKKYKTFYSDVANLSDQEALYHYIKTGRDEKRIYELPKDFNVKNYRNLHFDLSFMNDQEVMEHFIQHGIVEKRQYKGYNKFHKKDKEDKIKIIKEEKKKFLSQEIKKSNNQLPADFDVHGYRIFNPDLFYYDNDDYLIKHYLEIGKNENRLYKMPRNFDVELYKKLNPDTESLNKKDIIDHFRTVGRKEGRQYQFPEKFNFDFYRKIYLDNDQTLSDEEIKNHYLEIGIKKNYWIHLPDDFNLEIYKKLNRDLEALSNDEIVKQYVKIGYKTRIYK